MFYKETKSSSDLVTKKYIRLLFDSMLDRHKRLPETTLFYSRFRRVFTDPQYGTDLQNLSEMFFPDV